MKLKRGDALVVASHNKGKVREIEDLLAPFGFDCERCGRTRFAGTGRNRTHLRRKCGAESARRGECQRACLRWPTIPVCA